jgi:hypothetical protein
MSKSFSWNVAPKLARPAEAFAVCTEIKYTQVLGQINMVLTSLFVNATKLGYYVKRRPRTEKPTIMLVYPVPNTKRHVVTTSL